MRILVALFFLAFAIRVAHADIYEWTDDGGVVNFTDNQSEIPAKYRGKAVKRPEPAPVLIKPGVPQLITPGQKPVVPPQLFCGQDERTWRNRFAILRNDRKNLSEALADLQKQEDGEHTKMVRGIAIGKHGSRQAYIDFLKSVEQKETQLQEFDSQLRQLDNEASRCGVPVEWRQ